MSSNVDALYSHYRSSSVDAKQWVNTDLALVAKPGYWQRIFGDTSNTKISKVTEKLSKIAGPKALFIKRVLEVIAKGYDPGLHILRKINQCRELVRWMDPDLGLEKKFEDQEKAYLGISFDPVRFAAFYRRLQTLPHNTWIVISPDILMQIFAKLSFRDLAAASQACKGWAEAGKSQWQRQQKLKVNIPYLSSFTSTTFADVSRNRKWMAGFVGRSLRNTSIRNFSFILPPSYATSGEISKHVVRLKASGNYTFLGATPQVLFVQNQHTVEAHCMDTGEVVGRYNLDEPAMFGGASVSDGILYIQVNEHKLVYFDLLTCKKLSEITFPKPTKVIPFAQSILYTDGDELRMLK